MADAPTATLAPRPNQKQGGQRAHCRDVGLATSRSSLVSRRCGLALGSRNSSGTRREMQRRAFVKSARWRLVTLDCSRVFSGAPRLGWSWSMRQGKVLICLFQRGSGDALNIVARRREAYTPCDPRSRFRSGKQLDWRGYRSRRFLRTSSALAPLKPIYDRKLLAPIHAVGSRARRARTSTRGLHGDRNSRQQGRLMAG